MSITYLDSTQVDGVRTTLEPRFYSASGYGKKIPTRWQLKIDGRWYRVYVIQFSNAGSAYVIIQGEARYLGGFDPNDWIREHPGYAAEPYSKPHVRRRY